MMIVIVEEIADYDGNPLLDHVMQLFIFESNLHSHSRS